MATGSLDRLLAVDPVPQQICFAHHGRYSGDICGLLKAARDQLELWVTTVDQLLARRNLDAADETEALFPEMAEELKSVDPRFARGDLLPADIREREPEFTHQTLRGIVGYLKARHHD